MLAFANFAAVTAVCIAAAVVPVDPESIAVAFTVLAAWARLEHRLTKLEQIVKDKLK